MTESLLLIVAFCIAEFVHNILEVWGMRQKVSWLSKSMKGESHGSWPVNIDTKLKTAVLHLLILLVFLGLAFSVLKFLNLSDRTLIVLGIVTLLASYVYTTWKVDSFHSEIGKLISKVKKNKFFG
jgi:1,4-dihydroxy-2-naphthoate octaprenyltransferase